MNETIGKWRLAQGRDALGTGKAERNPNLLVIGASGLIGRRLLRRFGNNAVGTYRANAIPRGASFDLASDRIESLIDRLGGGFTHGIILAGISNIDRCARDHGGSRRINVDGVCRAIDGFAARGIFPVFASSDAVYSGSRGFWREADPCEPILEYGRQKRAVEQYLGARAAPSLALRIAKVLDPELDNSGVLGPWIADILAGRLIRCATDQLFCPVGVDDVVSAMAELCRQGVSGPFNLGGAEPMSRIELLEKQVAALARRRIVAPSIERCSLRDFPFAENRPLDLRLSIEKLRSVIDYRPESMESLCRRAADRVLQSAAS